MAEGAAALAAALSAALPSLLWWTATAFLAVQLLVLAVNAVSFPRLGRPRPDAAARAAARGAAASRGATKLASAKLASAKRATAKRARASLLVPARDEAHNLPRTLPGLLGQGAAEVIVLDDGSTDGTGELLASMAAAHPTLRVVRGRALPPGWFGKSWACRQLAEAARGDVLVFTDADVLWRPGALDAVLDAMERSGADLVTAWPRQRTRTLGERISVPQLDTLLLGALPWPLVGLLPFPSLAAANGQMMAWRRGAYRAVGGHASVRGEVLEDVALARRAKAAGMTLALRLGAPLLETRMYRSWTEVREGFGKSLLAAVGQRRVALVALVALNLLAHSASWLLALAQPRWWLVVALSLALRLGAELKAGRAPGDTLLQPLAPLALSAVAWRSWRSRGRVAWKARHYP